MTPVYEDAAILILTGITSPHLEYRLISSVGCVKGNTHVFSFVNGDPDLTKGADGEATMILTGYMHSQSRHRFLLNELPFFLLPYSFLPSIQVCACPPVHTLIGPCIRPSIQPHPSR